MKIIFEPDIEGIDYFEIILDEKEYDYMIDKGIAREFDGVFVSDKLNVNIRVIRCH